MSQKIGECPDQCSGRRVDRQMDIGRGLLEQFPEAARKKLVELGNPKRCTYCGCVYSGTLKIGVWDSGVLGQGWHSNYYPKI